MSSRAPIGLVSIAKHEAALLQEEMAGMLHVVQIVGVVHNALNIALVIPHFHLCLEYVFAHHFLFFSY